MKCSQCGREIPGAAVFCAYCGASTTATVPNGALKESSAQVTVSIQPTTRGKRFINMVVDGIVLQLVLSALRMFGLSEIFFAVGLPSLYFEWLIIPFAYFTIFEATLHKTPGKYVTKTHVATADGQPLAWSHAALRSVVRLIPFEAFSFLFTSRPVGWHDRAAKTIVRDD